MALKKQMELFDEGGMATAQEKLDAGVKELRTDRKAQFDKMTEMLTSGKVNDMSLEEKENFVKLYNLLKQHHSFNEGGLMDEGGSVDPVSGNDVPVGSTQEEVRDDIPAQLSEGEFVLPADVVRYHGLEKIMELRDEAKAGLQKMEDMGQMGNSEEAVLPDDIPFSADDLEIEDDGVAEYQVGGYVAPPSPFGVMGGGIQQPTYQQSQFANYQPQYQQYQAPAVPVMGGPTYQPPQQQYTPTMQQAAPSFSQFVVPRTAIYVDADGNTINVPVDENGNPLIPIPPGYTLKTDAPAQTTAPEQTTTPTTTTTAPPPDSGGDGGPPEGMSPEKQQEIKDRKSAAEQLGYTKQQGIGKTLLGLTPLGSLMGSPEIGTVLPDGTIADGEGNSFDPITGKQVGFSGGIIGNIAGGLGFGKVAPKDLAESIPESSYAGLRSMAGEKGIADLIGQDAYSKITGIDFGQDADQVKDVTQTAVTDITDTSPEAMQAAYEREAGVGVGSAQVRQADATAAEAASVVSQDADKTALPADFVGDTPTRAATPVDADEFASTTRSRTTPVDADEFAGDVDSKITTPTDPSEFRDPLEAFGGRGDDAPVSRPRVSTRTVQAEMSKLQDDYEREAFGTTRTPAQAQADAGAIRSSFPTRTQSFEDRDDYKGHVSSYESRGYSSSAARSAAANKTRADDEAMRQTGDYSGRTSAVTSSDGSAIRSSSGRVVTSGPPPSDDGGSTNDKIVCTAMNDAYGFGAFRQTIWLKHSKDMHPAYQKGYHRIFKPLIRFAYSDKKWYNTAVRKTLEGIARRRTADIWMQQRGKRHPIGAVERAILEPICYIVGKIK